MGAARKTSNTRRPKLGLVGNSTKPQRVVLEIAVPNSEPPTEFRIFTAGKVVTTKGTFVFDEKSAETVMAEYRSHGIELMVDYVHASIDADEKPDPAEAGKAAGWFDLEVRNGELWAVNVKWTEKAAQALRDREWRFMSPAFDVKDGRILTVLNVALTNIPATRNLDPLVAAARDMRTLSTGPSLNDVQCAIATLLAEMYPYDDTNPMSGAYVADVFDTTVVFGYDGKLFEVSYTFDGTVATLGSDQREVVRSYAPSQATPPQPAATAASKKKPAIKLANGGPLDPKLIKEALDALIAGDEAKCAEILKGLVASAAGATPDAAPAEDAAPPVDQSATQDPANPDKHAEVAVASAKLMRLTGATSFVEAIEKVDAFRASHIELETERQSLAKERATLESAERRKGCVELVTLGGMAPAAVWSDEKSTAPKKYLASMPIADFREFVSDAIKAKGGSTSRVSPPASASVTASEDGSQEFNTPSGVIKLSKRQLDVCAEMKVDPKVYAADLAAQKKG